MSNFTIADISKIPDIPQSFAPPAGMMGVFGENPWDVAARDADEAEAKRGMEISLLLNDSAYLGQRRVRDQTGKQTGANLRFIPEGITAAMLETGEMPAALIPAEFAGDGKRYADMLLDEGISEIAEVEVLKLRKGEGKGKLGITRELVSRNLAALAKLQPGVAGSWKAFFAAVRTHWGLATQRAVVMRMAERKGEYDPTEREAYLNKLLGLDAQVEHDAGVKDEFSRMMAGFDDVEADDIPFSIGRSPLRLAGTMDEATLAAAEFIGKPISNLDDGLTATLSKNTLGKMVSQSAARKSISPQAHAFSVANLDRLFKNAIRTHSGVDRDNDPNILAMHRYFSPILHMGEVLLAKLTVKEFARESEGSRIYSVEAMDVVKPAGNWVASISEERRNYTPQAGFEEKLQQRIDEVKPSGDASFSLGPAQVAGILSDNALGRITDPRRRTYVMAKISKDFNAMRLQIDRIASLAGVRRSKGDMRRGCYKLQTHGRRNSSRWTLRRRPTSGMRKRRLMAAFRDDQPITFDDVLGAAKADFSAFALLAGSLDPRLALVPVALRTTGDVIGLTRNGLDLLMGDEEEDEADIIGQAKEEVKKQADTAKETRKEDWREFSRLDPLAQDKHLAKLWATNPGLAWSFTVKRETAQLTQNERDLKAFPKEIREATARKVLDALPSEARAAREARFKSLDILAK